VALAFSSYFLHGHKKFIPCGIYRFAKGVGIYQKSSNTPQKSLKIMIAAGSEGWLDVGQAARLNRRLDQCVC
jgi:hypothetical protein